jgi:hypothetical protein
MEMGAAFATWTSRSKPLSLTKPGCRQDFN